MNFDNQESVKNLVMHPYDITTTFLRDIYSNLNYKLLNKKYVYSVEYLEDLFIKSERLLFMGHGAPDGLFGYKNILNDPIILDILKEKDNSIYIWCNADKFIKNKKLSGFVTGMIISEVDEASWFNIKVSQKQVDISNEMFANAIKNSIHLTPKEMAKSVIDIYEDGKLYLNNPVIDFNRRRIFAMKNGEIWT